MNLSETIRHAIAIAEAYSETELTSGADISFEVTPKSKVLDSWDSLPKHYEVIYRDIEVAIKHHGETEVVLGITIMKPRGAEEWQTATIECYIVGWVSGSYQYWARQSNRHWVLRGFDRFAKAESCGHFDFDYDWCEQKAIRLEKSAQTTS